MCRWHTKTLRVLRLLYSRGEEDEVEDEEGVSAILAGCYKKKLKTTAVCGAKAMPKAPITKPKQLKATSAAVVIDDSDDEVLDVLGCQTKEEWEQLQKRLQENILGNEEVEYILARRAEFEKRLPKMQQQRQQPLSWKFEEPLAAAAAKAARIGSMAAAEAAAAAARKC